MKYLHIYHCQFVVLSSHAWAEDYDGTKSLLCANIEAITWWPGEPCEKIYRSGLGRLNS